MCSFDMGSVVVVVVEVEAVVEAVVVVAAPIVVVDNTAELAVAQQQDCFLVAGKQLQKREE